MSEGDAVEGRPEGLAEGRSDGIVDILGRIEGIALARFLLALLRSDSLDLLLLPFLLPLLLLLLLPRPLPLLLLLLPLPAGT